MRVLRLLLKGLLLAVPLALLLIRVNYAVDGLKKVTSFIVCFSFKFFII